MQQLELVLGIVSTMMVQHLLRRLVLLASADGVVFLSDGRVVGSMASPTPERVLDALKTIGA